ncbi:MAG: cystathionine gamma-synthase family protein [Trueperaceae bacterium]|nr:cystathionine gamma-synthase family protein [Trueperaceae bacterium]MCW5818353.1 cystathionine gamma-synthase family protein [Trueperaceae bacterium]
MSEENGPQAATTAVWGGEEGVRIAGATQVPVVHSVAFGYDDLDHWRDVALGWADGHIYSRNTNPTVRAFEEKIRLLEGAEAATSFSTGMAAISATLFALLAPGERVVSVKDTYGGTNRLFLDYLPRFGIEVALCETDDQAGIVAAIDAGCKLVYLETPTNPTCKILDIELLARHAKAQGATVVVDNTFATPINQSPLALGADLVVHSATKYLGGHADALGGALCGAAGLVAKVFAYREVNGAALHADAAYLLLRGMKTLALRVERQSANAMAVARFLDAHPRVERVFYPGLPSHPNHAVAARQMRAFGGMLSFQLVGGFEAVKAFLPRLRFAHRAANLGAVETTVAPPRTGSHVELTEQERAAMGIPEALVRYSAGIEDVRDLIADLEQALAAAS